MSLFFLSCWTYFFSSFEGFRQYFL